MLEAKQRTTPLGQFRASAPVHQRGAVFSCNTLQQKRFVSVAIPSILVNFRKKASVNCCRFCLGQSTFGHVWPFSQGLVDRLSLCFTILGFSDC